ncbi:MAG: hypothetical protein WBN94_01710 [Methanothrix sp.]
MNKQFVYLTSILVLAMAASIAATAQESNATVNNTTLNNTILDNAAAGIGSPTGQNSTQVNDSADAVLDIGAASHASQNLSTVKDKPVVVADIGEMAGVAPLVAAGASSAQAASELAGSFKIGTGAGGLDPFNPKHAEIETLELGIATKPMRDTGKMFFVCDIV